MFIGTELYSLVYTLLMAAFALEQQSLVVMTETVWPAKTEIFSI